MASFREGFHLQPNGDLLTDGKVRRKRTELPCECGAAAARFRIVYGPAHGHAVRIVCRACFPVPPYGPRLGADYVVAILPPRCGQA